MERQEGRTHLCTWYASSLLPRYIYTGLICPGAFTPTCQAQHIPPYIKGLEELRSKGVDIVAVIASNDGWVMNAWGKINGVGGDGIVRNAPGRFYYTY